MSNFLLSSSELKSSISGIKSQEDFNITALQVFYFQYQNNPIYKEWVDTLKTDIKQIKNYSQIPFLPISTFKTHQVKSFLGDAQKVFSSSGTSGMQSSNHHVFDMALYQESYRKAFEYYYGSVKDYTILALLPSYLEREGSSLIWMVEDLISLSESPKSGFYLYNYAELLETILQLQKESKKVILLGVSFALLEFAEHFSFHFPELIVMETGGMKGRRKELLRDELHQILTQAFGVQNIHSEYGMSEMLSQAYSSGKGIFQAPPWMKILIRDTNDPLSLLPTSKAGGINVIDLYNLYSCSFIATQDLGKVNSDGSFEILGRFDHSDIRGCNLLVL